MSAERCKWPDGMSVRPDGETELDPCLYEEIECYRNVTIHVLQCVRCGRTICQWKRQENTEEVPVKEVESGD